MTEQRLHPDVDRYVRDELSDEEVADFEERLLEDVELQDQVEAALGLREALRFDAPIVEAAPLPAGNPWSPYALAASILLAVVSTTLYWRSSVETGELRNQLENLRAPQANILAVPVDIMRSAGGTPDVIIQKPAVSGAVLLDIELSTRMRQAEHVEFTLRPEGGEVAVSWTAPPGAGGRTRVLIPAATLPDGRAHLEMSTGGPGEPDRRLIEFLPPAD